jgi:hypothetical protein
MAVQFNTKHVGTVKKKQIHLVLHENCAVTSAENLSSSDLPGIECLSNLSST